MTKSKSKTFHKGTDMGEVVEWFYDQVKTNDSEVIYPGAEPSMDLIVETDSKYLITITKYPENENNNQTTR